MILGILTSMAIPDQKPTAPMDVPLKVGQTFSASARIVPKVYRLANKSEDLRGAALYVKANNITIDFQGAVLEGTPQTTEPNLRIGTGLLVTGKNITLKNLKIRGYKIGLAALRSPGLKLINVDGSYNWKQRLLSNLDREDGADWMSYHQNEKNEWLRYGAAFYLRGCDGFEVKNCRAVGGQCGLMITQCNKGLIWNNAFSFLSAVGLGMYRSSDNKILHNKIDWCVRGFSYGKYNRGQDSTGILIYEQSHRNTFAYNSVTHGGDGFFLWAGQTTMDTGKGGCNDNLLYANDFSHAPANGIEATFSRNKFANNLMLECWHGIWGGYSYETPIVGNIFAHNQESIAIEHGQDNTIAYNSFSREHDGLVIWANNRPPDPNWGYPKHRDTKSRDYKIENNDFDRLSGTALKINNSSNISNDTNSFRLNAQIFGLKEPLENFSFSNNDGMAVKFEPEFQRFSANNKILVIPNAEVPKPATSLSPGADLNVNEYLSWFDTYWQPYLVPKSLQTVQRPLTEREKQVVATAPFFVPPINGGRDPFLKKSSLRGWRYILVDQWGPYDFKSPILWPRGEVKDGLQTFEILGPKGRARVIEELGCWINGVSGDGGKTWTPGDFKKTSVPVPSFVRVAYPPGTALERKLSLEYKGESVIDYRGVYTAKGKPFRFGFSQFFLPIEWTVKFFKWDDSNDPRTKAEAFQTLINGTPIKTERVDRINYAGDVPGVPSDHFATVAEGTFEVAAGDYVLNLTTDDGAKVWVDGELVVKDAWKYQGPTLYAAPLKLSAGKHRVRVEHFEIDGYSALKVELVKK